VETLPVIEGAPVLIAWFLAFFITMLVIFINGLCLQYVINYWVSYIQKKRAHVPLVIAIIGSFFVPAIYIAIITWIISYALDNPYY